MKLHHAAALALVGWYLMFPPLRSEGGKLVVDPDAPLSKWTVYAAHDSADDCEREREFLGSKVSKEKRPKVLLGQTFCECISTDDPRLKGR